MGCRPYTASQFLKTYRKRIDRWPFSTTTQPLCMSFFVGRATSQPSEIVLRSKRRRRALRRQQQAQGSAKGGTMVDSNVTRSPTDSLIARSYNHISAYSQILQVFNLIAYTYMPKYQDVHSSCNACSSGDLTRCSAGPPGRWQAADASAA